MPVEAEATPLRTEPPAPRGSWWPWFAAGLAGTVALVFALMVKPSRREEVTQELVVDQEESDGGTVALGDSALTAPVASAYAPSAGVPIALDMPPKPLPGQIRPDARGGCPYEPLVLINGGCWLKVEEDAKTCSQSQDTYVYKGACYLPVARPSLPPTSSPPESRDGG